MTPGTAAMPKNEFYSLLCLAVNKHFISASSSASLAMTKTPGVRVVFPAPQGLRHCPHTPRHCEAVI